MCRTEPDQPREAESSQGAAEEEQARGGQRQQGSPRTGTAEPPRRVEQAPGPKVWPAGRAGDAHSTLSLSWAPLGDTLL